MASNKRARRNSSSRPDQANAQHNPAPATPAVGPTISVTASPLRDSAASTRSPTSPVAERAAMAQRRNLIIAGAGLLALLIAFLAYRSLTFEPPTAATPAVVPTAAAPTAIAALIAAPISAPTAAAAGIPTLRQAQGEPQGGAPAIPTAAAAAAPALPTAAAAAPAAPTTCTTIAGLPVFAGATCIDQDTDQDDGVTKLENTYTSTATADEFRRFYETALAQNGWIGPDFQYDLQQGLRRMQVDVETKPGAQGNVTELRIAEK